MPSQADRIKVFLENNVDETMRETAEAVYEELVDGVPVRSGRLRASFKMSRGEPDTSRIPQKKGKYAKPETPKLPPAKPGEPTTIYITNPVGYAAEVNSGSATNAPTRFLQAAVARGLQKVKGI